VTETPNLDLPYIMAAQAQKHVTHNEAVRALDAIVQLSVRDRDLTAPPGSPADGDRHIIAAGATGGWATHDGDVAAYQDGTWMFYAPRAGWVAWIADEAKLCAWDGSGWVAALLVDPATGYVGIGTASPAVALDVDGPVRVKSYTVAGLPGAAAGAGQIVCVSNETGGPVLAFSDGTSWRRVTDRAVVS
jgi:Protein of unknown function (DUF2793)